MRVVAALIFLLWAQSSFAVSMTRCPDGVHFYPTATGASYCPSNITVTKAAPTNVTIDVEGTATTLSGTVYAVVRSSCTIAHWRNNKNGTGAIATASDTDVSSGVFSMTVSGLTASTSYCLQIVQVDAGDKPTRTITQAFETQSAPPIPEDEIGSVINTGDADVDRFYCESGNDSADNTSPLTPKKTLPLNNTNLGDSNDIWLCRGSTWNKVTIDLTVGGTISDPAEFGCYYLDGTDARRCLDNTPGFGSIDTKPVIRGGLTDLCIEDASCTFPSTNISAMGEGFTSKDDSAIFVSSGADYTTISNIELRNIRYRGLTATGGGVAQGLTRLIVDGLDLRNAGRLNVTFENGVYESVYRNSTVYNTNLCPQIVRTRRSADASACPEPTWGSGLITVARKSSRVLVEKNWAYHSFGEGIIFYNCQGGGFNIARGNTIMAHHSTSIYVDGCANNIVENNIVLGGNGSWLSGRLQMGTVASFQGFQNGKEKTAYNNSIGNLVRNNLLVGTNTCVRQAIGSASEPTATGEVGVKVYGNTCIGSRSVGGGVVQRPNSGTIRELAVTGNAFWEENHGASTICSVTTMTGGYNWYSSIPSDSDCVKTGNLSPADGAISLSQSTFSWWTTLAANNWESTEPTPPTFANAEPSVGSELVGTSTPLRTPIVDISNYGFAWDQIAEVRDATLTEANWECALCIDALGTARDASTPDMGAVEYTP